MHNRRSHKKMIERIKNLNLSTIHGENVLQATSLIRGAITRLGDCLLDDISDILLKVYQTSSYQRFNMIFDFMEISKKIKPGMTYTVQEITSVANSN